MPWLLLDVVWIVLFAILGLQDHAGDSPPLAVLSVAWPFFVGYLISLIVLRLGRAPRSLARGTLVWLGTLVIGIAIRTVLKGYLPEPVFIIIAALFLGLGFVGWRVVALIICRRRANRDSATDST